MKEKKYMRYRTQEGTPDTAYLELQDHPHEPVRGIVARTVVIGDLINGYDGPRIALHFNASNRPVGIEVLYPTQHEDDESDLADDYPDEASGDLGASP